MSGGRLDRSIDIFVREDREVGRDDSGDGDEDIMYGCGDWVGPQELLVNHERLSVCWKSMFWMLEEWYKGLGRMLIYSTKYNNQ